MTAILPNYLPAVGEKTDPLSIVLTVIGGRNRCSLLVPQHPVRLGLAGPPNVGGNLARQKPVTIAQLILAEGYLAGHDLSDLRAGRWRSLLCSQNQLISLRNLLSWAEIDQLRKPPPSVVIDHAEYGVKSRATS
jgi:hypothetical protein